MLRFFRHFLDIDCLNEDDEISTQSIQLKNLKWLK